MNNFILSLQGLLPTSISFLLGFVGAFGLICLLCKPKTRKAYWIYISIYTVGMIGFIPAMISIVHGS